MSGPGFVVWLYGLSGSGKSTLARALVHELEAQQRKVLRIDGDDLRAEICRDLDFSMEGRRENIRRAAGIAQMALAQGMVAVVSLITPVREFRQMARAIIGAEGLAMIYLDCPVEECRRRDPKGLYARASKGLVAGMTGIDSTFEPAEEGELRVDTAAKDVSQCIAEILSVLPAA